MMVNCLDINDAANNFVQLHDPAKIDLDYMKKEYGTIANYLDFAGSSLDDQGSRYIEIDSHDSLIGTPQIIEWCEDCYAIGYRHVDSSFPNMEWVKTFLEACNLADDLRRDGYVEIGITFWSDGNPQHSIDCDREDV